MNDLKSYLLIFVRDFVNFVAIMALGAGLVWVYGAAFR